MFQRCHTATVQELPQLGCPRWTGSAGDPWWEPAELHHPTAHSSNPRTHLGWKNTFSTLEFNQIKHYIQATSTAAKKLALKLPKPHPSYFQSPQGSYWCRSAAPDPRRGRLAPLGLIPPEEPPKPTLLSWQPAQWGKKKTERMENPGKRFNMSSDELFLTRRPKLGFFFLPRSFFI